MPACVFVFVCMLCVCVCVCACVCILVYVGFRNTSLKWYSDKHLPKPLPNTGIALALQEMFEEGLIDKDDYKEQKKTILAENYE